MVNGLLAFLHAGFLIFTLGFILLPVAFVYSNQQYHLTLERIIPNNHNIELNELKNRDRTRHGRILQQSSIGVVHFSVQGSAHVGLYFTRVKLGSPPKEFNVVIDTGSDMLWVNCNSCSGCPKSSGLGIELQFFDPGSSSSASPISCTDSVCRHTAEAGCLENSQCGYQYQYGDGSETAGFYVSDLLGLDTDTGNSLMSNSSSPVVFGCSIYLSGDFTETDSAVDGVLGFGQHGMSIIQQLSSRGMTPRVFSHCLDGTGSGGGVLVLGEVVAEGIVYSPLVPSRSLYNLDLQSIAINGQLVPIDPAVFSNGQGTIVDSGTTLAHLPEEALDPFVTALVAVVQESVKPFVDKKGNQCFIAQTSVSEAFPSVMLNFAGDATMVLKPENYLVQTSGHQGEWCVGFQNGDLLGQRITILGDLVLKDKIIIYDLARQRIGWVNYDCSQSVNVTLGSGNEKIREDALYQLIVPIAATAISLYISLFTGF